MLIKNVLKLCDRGIFCKGTDIVGTVDETLDLNIQSFFGIHFGKGRIIAGKVGTDRYSGIKGRNGFIGKPRVFVFAAEIIYILAKSGKVLVVFGKYRKVGGTVRKLQIRIGNARKIDDLFFGKEFYLADKSCTFFI